MILRLKRSAISLAVVLLCYGMYRAVAVPLIEPAAVEVAAGASSAELAMLLPSAEQELHGWFPEGSWQLNNPVILETDRGRLLFDQYKILGDGYMKITPCSMIFTTEDPRLSEEENRRRAVILDAEQGAILQFDKPLNMTSGDIGKLIGASIGGPVIIRSDRELPGPEDDLLIETSDVQLTEAQIATNSLVKFRLAENVGQGRRLRIDLLRSTQPGDTSQGPKVDGLLRLVLEKDVEMLLHMGAIDFGNEKPVETAAAPEAPAPPTRITSTGPFTFDFQALVVSFDDQVLVQRLAPGGTGEQLQCDRRLELHLSPEDQLGQPAPDPAIPRPPRIGFDLPPLKPARLVASGQQVRVSAPEANAIGQGQLLEYDFVDGTVTLKGEPTARLARESDQIQAPEIFYRPEEGRQLGRFLARGAGWLEALLPGDDAQPVEINWKQELRVVPDDKAPAGYIASVRGAANVNAVRLGSMAAEEIYVWLTETPAEPHPAVAGPPVAELATEEQATSKRPKVNVRPDRLQATGNVQLSSPQMTANVETLRLWFEHLSEGPRLSQHAPAAWPLVAQQIAASPAFIQTSFYQPATASGNVPQPPQGSGYAQAPAYPPGQPSPPSPQLPPERSVYQRPRIAQMQTQPDTPPLLAQQIEALPRQAARGSALPLSPRQYNLPELYEAVPAPDALRPEQPLTTIPSRQPARAPDDRLDVRGRQLMGKIVMRLNQMELRHLTVEENVLVRQFKADNPEPELQITGNRLQVDSPTPQAAIMAVTGAPAKVAARGMTMQGGQINLNRGENRLWIDGPGQMTLPASRDLQGNSLAGLDAPRGDVEISWAARMHFDGQTADFEQDVRARSGESSLKTPIMKARLDRRIDFMTEQRDVQPQLEIVGCRHGVEMATRTLNEHGELEAKMDLTGSDLTLNQITGDLDVGGPGIVRTVRRDNGSRSLVPLGGVAGSARPATKPTPAAQPSGLSYLSVEYLRGITGNIHSQRLSFHQRVKATYGPVTDWDSAIGSDDLQALGDRGMFLTCEQLNVNQIPDPSQGRSFMELEASGGPMVEGQRFAARGQRISYAESKSLLTLAGDSRHDAELYRENDLQPQRAGLIRYRPTTGEIEVDQARMFDLTP